MYYFSKIILLSQEKEPFFIKRLFFVEILVIVSVLVVVLISVFVLIFVLVIILVVSVLAIVLVVSVFVLVSVLIIHNFLPKLYIKRFDLSVSSTLSSIMPQSLRDYSFFIFSKKFQ